jgi:hypothetical protein
MWMFSAGRGAAAEIRVDGAAVKRVSLAEDAEFSIGWRPNVRFAVKNGAIAFTESDCPDKVCIQSGFLSKPGQSAACLPNRVSLRVSGEAGDADAVGR